VNNVVNGLKMDLQKGLEKKAEQKDLESTNKVKADKSETDEIKERIEKLEEFAKQAIEDSSEDDGEEGDSEVEDEVKPMLFAGQSDVES
jgi:hypothetical protein